MPLLTEFAARDCHALAFDFSGHGESTGLPREPAPPRESARRASPA
ncbi:hypothetical protein ACFU3E_38095 [Streptomyces sp. NPDC057424]